jgi:hypothetical protein
MLGQTEREKKRTRSAIRYAALKAQGLCVECKQPVNNGKTACAPCLANRRRYQDGRATAKASRITMIGGFVAVSLEDTLEILGLKIEYSHSHYRFSGKRTFWVDREVGDPFDALRSKGMIPRK